jgi:phosphoribosylformimino-5-aminoimidazole carboxamide ribotide isomerase
MEVAADYIRCGAKLLHCIDLDGAGDGIRRNAHIVRALCATSLQVELGGGLRNLDDLADADALGVWRFVIGSAAVTDRDFVKTAIDKYGAERVVVGIDALDGKVRTHGWKQNSGLDALEFATEIVALGVKAIIFTDISTDGTLNGPPLQTLKIFRERFPDCALVASGGIANIGDIFALNALNLDSAIIGKAYFAKTIDLQEAIKVAR